MAEHPNRDALHPRYGLGAQLQRAFHGLTSGASGNSQEGPLLRSVVHLSESLVAHQRFVLDDFHERAGKDAWLCGTALAAVARCVPLTLWLRGPDPRLVLAAFRLAWSTAKDPTAANAAAFLCLWMRVLVRRVGEDMGWAEAKERLLCANECIHPPLDGIEEFLEHLDENNSHPVFAGLRMARDQLAQGGTPAQCIARLRASGEEPGLQAITAALAGIREQPVDHREPAPQPPDDQRFTTLLSELIQPWLLSRRLEAWPPVTSETHPLAIASVQAGAVRIGVSHCPGCSGHFVPGGVYARTLGVDIARIAGWGAHHVVCVMDNDSLLDVGGGDTQPELERRGIRFWHVPWLGPEDRDWFNSEWGQVRRELLAAVLRGESVLLYGLDFDTIAVSLAAELLQNVRKDLSPEEALAQVVQATEQAQKDFDELREDL